MMTYFGDREARGNGEVVVVVVVVVLLLVEACGASDTTGEAISSADESLCASLSSSAGRIMLASTGCAVASWGWLMIVVVVVVVVVMVLVMVPHRC
jgi:hypothetical protein